MGRISRILNIYKGLLKHYPILVQSVQAGFLTGTGDLIAQTVVEKKSVEALDLGRTFKFSAVGALIVGPALTLWYRGLSKIFGDSGKTTVLKKVAADQLLFVPVIQAAGVITKNGLDGRDWEFIREQLRLKYTDILLANYKIWPAVQVINFYVVPLNYQVLVVQTVALFWIVYFCWKTEQGLEDLD